MRALLGLSLLVVGCGGAACPSPDTAEESAGGEAPAAEIRALEDAPRRAAPPGTATVAILAQGRNAFVARLEMEPGAAVPEHADADEEYIVVLEGRGVITIDGVETEIGPGSTVFMPAGATVSYRNGDAPMVALQVFAGPASAAKYERWTPIDG
ncbi:MAG: cupin domain-containing protein [Myxococcota bacterium]|nr:cupin domain-containing protein [Myxococcota bacterium]